MRHVLAAPAVAACPRGMGEPPAAAALVSPPGILLGTAAGTRCASPSAVELAAIATTANQHLGATACAEKQPGRRSLSVCGSADARWTAAAIAGILALHSCPARCEARRRCRTCRLGSAPCLPRYQRVLSAPAAAASARDRPARWHHPQQHAAIHPPPHAKAAMGRAGKPRVRTAIHRGRRTAAQSSSAWRRLRRSRRRTG